MSLVLDVSEFFKICKLCCRLTKKKLCFLSLLVILINSKHQELSKYSQFWSISIIFCYAFICYDFHVEMKVKLTLTIKE